MKIGIAKEVKNSEYRVGLTPNYVALLVASGHQIWVENNAGSGVQMLDEAYQDAGAKIVNQSELYQNAELIIKVKEPQPSEYSLLKPNHILFTFLHLAANPNLAKALCNSGATCIAYETIQMSNGQLPVLYPMSEIAGRLSIQAGARMLEKPQSGMGKLLSGLAGVKPADVVIIGAGVVGENALQMAIGAQANVTILDTNLDKLRAIQSHYKNQVCCLLSNSVNLKQCVLNADLIVGSVLLPGKQAPKLVPQSWLSHMRRGAVLVDVAIDQGGCFESSTATTHQEPSYVKQGIVHYCVSNMPGAVPISATESLTNVTYQYIEAIAELGLQNAIQKLPELKLGLNIQAGEIIHEAIAESLAKG